MGPVLYSFLASDWNSCEYSLVPLKNKSILKKIYTKTYGIKQLLNKLSDNKFGTENVALFLCKSEAELVLNSYKKKSI